MQFCKKIDREVLPKKKCITRVKTLFCLCSFVVLTSAYVSNAANIADGISADIVSDTFPSLPVIDNAVYAFMTENNVPGISLAITKNEKIVYLKGYGFADREARTRVTPESLFRIASISKPITSIAILKLLDEKKLSLDDTVFGAKGILKRKYGKKKYSKDITDITIRHLLQHLAGGWGNSRNDPMFTDTSRSIDELITFTLDTFPLTNAPGTKYDYSNFGYCVLGRVIEKLTGQNYEQYVKEHILSPAGITDMQIGGNTREARKPNEVVYYGQKNENPYCCNVSRMDAHGGWIASARDLVLLLAHADGLSGVKDLISPESINTMITAPIVSPKYACGWVVDGEGNWQHGGSLPGTRTELRRRNNGYGYAILMNTRSGDTTFTSGLHNLMLTIQAVRNFMPPGDPAAAINDYRPFVPDSVQRAARLKAAFPVIDKIYKTFAEENNVPGLVVGIAGDGKLLFSGAYGYSDVDKNIPVTSSSVYRIASMTKSFAAMAILMLRDMGKLDLDDPVSVFIPEVNSIRPLTDDSPPITIRHILTHTAGFPEDNPWADRQLQRTDQELLDFIKNDVSLSNTPGMGYEYSNLGYAMLGVIITRASGEHYEQFIKKHIFDPLGMSHTYWEYTDVPADQLVHGYRRVNGKWRKEEMLHSGAYGIMGGLLTSVEDFSKYMNLHISAWPPRSGADTGILKRSSLREMHLPSRLSSFLPTAVDAAGEPCPRASSYNFGLSWSKDCTGIERVTHSGGLPGFGTQWTLLPQYGIAMVAFSNLTYSAVSALNAKAIDTLIALAGLQPMRLPPSSILEQRKNELLNLLPDWKNAEASGIFSENFFSDYFVDSLRKEARALFGKTGKIIRAGAVTPDNQLRGNFILEGERANLVVRFTLSPEKPALIQHFSIRELSSAGAKYGLKAISSPMEYLALVADDKKQQLVALDKLIPGITLDIRYATSNNLMKRPVYKAAAAYMRQPAAQSLKKIQAELKPLGYGLKIYDGYRPYDVTVAFYEAFRDTVFVASPYTGSRHNRGCAVDLTLIDLKTGKELEMPTPYDSFTKEAHAEYQDIPANALKNRELLQRVMLKHGFRIYPDEWWHFDFEGWQQYPVMNIPFETLRGL